MCLSLFREIKTTRSNCCCLVTIKLNIKKRLTLSETFNYANILKFQCS